jgi:hypothetical protein
MYRPLPMVLSKEPPVFPGALFLIFKGQFTPTRIFPDDPMRLSTR